LETSSFICKCAVQNEVPLNCGFHDSVEAAISSRQNAENELTGTLVPLNCGFHDSAEVEFLGRQNAENEITGT